MRMLVQYSDGTVEAAILLAVIGNRLRAAAPGCEDAVEFQRKGEQWLTETGEAVEVTFDPDPETFERAAEAVRRRPDPVSEAPFPCRRAQTPRETALTSVN